MRDRAPTLERRVEQAEAQAVLASRLAAVVAASPHLRGRVADADEVIAAADVADDLEHT
jgi:hypothetical protein